MTVLLPFIGGKWKENGQYGNSQNLHNYLLYLAQVYEYRWEAYYGTEIKSNGS